jgi:acyl-CoA synthetase (AMP-forming)/AMP-acid ligase II
LTVPALLKARAETHAERAAMVMAGGRTLTFADWAGRAAAVAGGLVARGVRPGDRVVLRFGNHEWIDFATAYAGTQWAGAVAVPVSDRLADAEVAYIVADCGAVTTVDGGADLEGAPLAEPVPGPGDLAQILYTSGTTGRPKGVSASHANLTFGCVPGPRRLRLAHSAHFLHAFPIGTNAGQTMLVNALDAHPAALVLPRFTPGRFARLIAERRVGTAFVVPAMAIELLSAGVAGTYDLSSVRLLGSTGAALPPAVAAALAAALPGATIVNYYTSTEAAPAQTTMVFDPARPASVGRATAGSGLRVAGPDGEPLPPGEVGDVWLRSPAGSRAYYGDPAAGRDVFRGGWVRMGDLGYLDDEGYLYLVDRESDVVKSGGYKVSTLHVEAALHEHPEVVEAAAFGVPHPVLGTAVAAAVVARSEVSAAGLRAFLATRLAPHELPAPVLRLDRLPRNDAGKVLKRELRRLAAGDGRQP